VQTAAQLRSRRSSSAAYVRSVKQCTELETIASTERLKVRA
jgi:hypothetical protein